MMLQQRDGRGQNVEHVGTGNSIHPSCSQLFWVFTRIALTSCGGGVSGWLLREFVQNRKWMTQEEFLNGLSISQALPGVNVKNMAVWIGPGATALTRTP